MHKKIMKITIALLLILFVSIGSILLANKLVHKKSEQVRNYIIASPSGSIDYPFPMTFEKGISAYEIASSFSNHYSRIQRKQGTRLIPVEPSQKIYSDISIKIS